MARTAEYVGARLEAYEAQARPFYERFESEVFGVLEGDASGTRTCYREGTVTFPRRDG
jgi:hypothetical protein